MLFVKVTLKDGESFISQFTKLRGIGTYASNVMSGKQALNVWKVIGHEHPASGERTLVRQRKMVSGTEVASMEEVMPKADATDEQINTLGPTYFEARPHIEKGPHGHYQFDEADEAKPEGAQTKLPYPLHRDPDTLRRYVILNARGEVPVRHYLDPESIAMSAVEPTGDADVERAEDFTREYDDDETF